MAASGTSSSGMKRGLSMQDAPRPAGRIAVGMDMAERPGEGVAPRHRPVLLQQPVVEDQFALAHHPVAMGRDRALRRDLEDVEAEGVVLVDDVGGTEGGVFDLELGPPDQRRDPLAAGAGERHGDGRSCDIAGGEEIAPDHVRQRRRRYRAMNGIDQERCRRAQAGRRHRRGWPWAGRQRDREAEAAPTARRTVPGGLEPAVGEAECEPVAGLAHAVFQAICRAP